MKFSKTIAAVALSASSAFALMAPTDSKVYCVDIMRNDASGAVYVGTCDQTANNKELGKELLENGCAEGQGSLRAFEVAEGKFDIEIGACFPPGVVQL